MNYRPSRPQQRAKRRTTPIISPRVKALALTLTWLAAAGFTFV